MKSINFLTSDYLNNLVNKKDKNRELVKELLNKNSKRKKYIVGLNKDAENLTKLVRFDGVLNDFTPDKTIYGIKVISIADIPFDAIVVNCSTSISPINLMKALHKHMIENIVTLHDLIDSNYINLKVPTFVEQQRSDIFNNIQDWIQIYNKLEDHKSKRIFEDVVSFRLTADISFMNKYTIRFKEQYFEDFLKLNNETFADCGGFDGDTTEYFCSVDENYKSVKFFEPSKANMSKAKKRLSCYKNIDFIPLGVSDKNEILTFNENAGSSSSIDVSGKSKIEVDKIDDVISEPLTFIKMDLEGWELKALKGAFMQIKNNKPKLAIAVYHNAADFRNIFNYVLSIHSDYKIRMAHYSQGWSETIMFFTPE